MFRRLLFAKNLVLWALVAPVCSLVALIIGVSNHDYIAMIITIIAITVMPFGVLGISAWVGIRFPYHPIPLGERWAHRRPWRHMLVRWLVLVVTPYGLVPALGLRFHHAHAVALGNFRSERAHRPPLGRRVRAGCADGLWLVYCRSDLRTTRRCAMGQSS